MDIQTLEEWTMAGPAPCPTMDCGDCVACLPWTAEQYWRDTDGGQHPVELYQQVTDAIAQHDRAHLPAEAWSFAELATYDALQALATELVDLLDEHYDEPEERPYGC